MKIIDILNKIANGEEVPKLIKYENEEYKITKILMEDNEYLYNYTNDDMECLFPISSNILNNEVEILEEEKKIPEKIKIEGKSITVKGTTFFREKDIEIFQKLSMEINEIIDYLKSKGEQV